MSTATMVQWGLLAVISASGIYLLTRSTSGGAIGAVGGWFGATPNRKVIASIAGGAFGLLVLFLGAKDATLAGTAQIAQTFWLPLLAVAGILFCASLVPWIAGYAKLLKACAIGLVGFCLMAPITAWIGGKFDSDCTRGHPCEPLRAGSGETEEVLIPEGRTVCFESSFQTNRQQLGFATSYAGSAWCTQEEAQTGSCSQAYADRFKFAPGSGTAPPRHWFVRAGSAC